MNQALLQLGIEEESQKTVIEIFGQEFFDQLSFELDWISKNVATFQKYHIDFYSEIFERYPELFIQNPKILEQKLRCLIENLGIEYLDRLGYDLSVLELMID